MVSPVASAGGIPVINTIAIAKSVAQLVQMKTQIKLLKGAQNLNKLLKKVVKDRVSDESKKHLIT